MDRDNKGKLIAALKKTFEETGLVVVTRPTGLTVAEVTDLRRQMRAAGAGFKVAKNRLARLALDGTRFQGLGSLLKGPTGIAFSQDPVAAAKVAVEYAAKNQKLEILGGGLGDRRLSAEAVNALAKLPSLPQLRASLLGLFMTPATRVAVVVQAPAAQLARVVNARALQGQS